MREPSPVSSPHAPPGLRVVPGGAPPRQAAPRPYTVGEVMAQVRSCLEDQFRPVLVVGEVGDLRRPRGGHVYLTLRDASARLRVVVFADVADGLEGVLAPLRDGDEVLVWGKVTAYATSGDVQLVAARVEAVGAGALRRRRDELGRKLEAEGLFDPKKKLPLPFLPRAVGIVTSPTGAALQDVRNTLERRFPTMSVVFAPVKVHGPAAAQEIARQLAALDRCGKVDVILLVRGGGAREDLAPFDEEVVVRAVAACATPVVTGIGHETDTTLADHAADRRAPTPTAAAELVVPVLRDLERELDRRGARLRAAALVRVRAAQQRLSLAARAHGLRATGVQLAACRARLDAAAGRLAAADPRARLARWRELLDQAEVRLQTSAPRVGPRAEALERAEARLRSALVARVRAAREAVAQGAGRLHALSPLAVLARGFSLTTKDGVVLQDAFGLAPGDVVRTRLADGAFQARVLEVEARASRELDSAPAKRQAGEGVP